MLVKYSILTKEFLEKEYVINKKSTIKIGNEVGCDRSVIVRKLHKLGIESRTRSLAGKLKLPMSDDTKKKIGEKSKLKLYTEEYRKKLSIASSKRIWTDESREKLSKSKKASCILNPPIGLKGDKNPSWKGGISPFLVRIRNSKEYKIWRISVWERDGFTCVKCGNVGKDLHAHHVKSFSEYHDLRFELDNGTTLCKDCHHELHWG